MDFSEIALAKRSRAGATKSEWNAQATGRRRAAMPTSFNAVSARSRSATAPARTVCDGALKLAKATPLRSLTVSRICASVPLTAVIVPKSSPPSRIIASPRACASDQRSCSENAPAADSAESSPKLCPATAPASAPNPRNRDKMPFDTAPMAGCATSVRISALACSARSDSSSVGLGYMRSVREPSRTSVRWALAASSDLRMAGNCIVRPEAILGYCDPCPGNKNAT